MQPKPEQFSNSQYELRNERPEGFQGAIDVICANLRDGFTPSGTIKVESQPGLGSRFFIWLPGKAD